MHDASAAPYETSLETELSRLTRAHADLSVAEIIAALERLAARHPKSGRAHEEIGHIRRAAGDDSGALLAFQKAVELNDALAQSWLELEKLYRANGRHSDALAAAACVERLASLPAQVARASYLLNEGELTAAEETARRYLRRHGAHIEGMRVLAQIAMQLNVLDDAETLLATIIAMRPEYEAARFEYAWVLMQRRHYLPAKQEMCRLLEHSRNNDMYQKLYASICDGLGETEEALRTYGKLSAESPQESELLVSMAHIFRTRGDIPAAVELLQSAAQSPTSFASACFALSNIKSHRFTDRDLSRMIRTEAELQIPLADRYHLCFAIARIKEQRAEYQESFAYYSRGSALKRSEIKADPRVIEQTMQRQTEVCTAEFFAARRGFGCAQADPIFIVGMPRAGSTLLEQILASHSQIDGTFELPDIPRLVHQFRRRDSNAPPPYPAALADLSRADFAAFGQDYLAGTRVHRKGAPHFIDKMPNNFRDVAFIHLILPNAKIIDARRDPLPCCFGNFKQLFPNGMEFKYSLEEIGRYYCSYVKLMDHWDRVLPGKVLRVQHEDVVNDLEGSVRRILSYLDLPFEPACLEFYKTERAVRTVSSDQVRRPIYREGLDQWRHFEPWLGPLKAALAPLIELDASAAAILAD